MRTYFKGYRLPNILSFQLPPRQTFLATPYLHTNIFRLGLPTQAKSNPRYQIVNLKKAYNFSWLRKERTEYRHHRYQLAERLSFLYRYAHYSITRLNGFKNIHSLDELTKYRVLTIKVVLRSISNKKLGTIGIGTAVSH